jgi:hypothetical protein
MDENTHTMPATLRRHTQNLTAAAVSADTIIPSGITIFFFFFFERHEVGTHVRTVTVTIITVVIHISPIKNVFV